jgi:hypothetical protein
MHNEHAGRKEYLYLMANDIQSSGLTGPWGLLWSKRNSNEKKKITSQTFTEYFSTSSTALQLWPVYSRISATSTAQGYAVQQTGDTCLDSLLIGLAVEVVTSRKKSLHLQKTSK